MDIDLSHTDSELVRMFCGVRSATCTCFNVRNYVRDMKHQAGYAYRSSLLGLRAYEGGLRCTLWDLFVRQWSTGSLRDMKHQTDYAYRSSILGWRAGEGALRCTL